jgi:hypothetical protein
MSHEYKLLCLVFNALNRVDHTHVLAHLECGFSIVKLKIFQALFSKALKELKTHFLASFGDLNTVLILVKGKTLKEVSQMAFIRIFIPSPLIDLRMSLQILSSDTIRSSM